MIAKSFPQWAELRQLLAERAVFESAPLLLGWDLVAPGLRAWVAEVKPMAELMI